MVPALTGAGIKPAEQLFNISAGDGSTSAYQRIDSNQYRSLDPKELQDLDELKASWVSRKTAWDILQELRSILNEHGVNLAPPVVRNIGVEGQLVRDGVRKALVTRRTVIEHLIKAISEYRKSGRDHQAVHALNKALEVMASIIRALA